MKLSEKGRALLIELEGKRNHVYEDVAGLKTIGVGHLLKLGETMTEITDDQINDLLSSDLVRFERTVNNAVKVELNQSRFDALVIFVFNIGVFAFLKSTLLKNLNRSQYDNIPAQIMRWNKAGGKVSEGLTNRRKAEIKLWEGAGCSASHQQLNGE